METGHALSGLAVVEVQLGLCSFAFTFLKLRGLLKPCKTPFCFTNAATSQAFKGSETQGVKRK